MSQEEDFIRVARRYIEEIDVIANTSKRDLSQVLSILNCLRISEGWKLGVRFAEFEDYGDKSWFYCYQGETDTYAEDYRNYVETGNTSGMNYFFQCENFDPIFEIFQHINVEKSPMGAWQAYLLSEATALLPCIWHGAYGSRKFIFSKEDITSWLFLKDVKRNDVDENFAPQISMDGDVAIISCYYLNTFRGLFYDKATLVFSGSKVSFSKNRIDKLIYKSRCELTL